MCCAAAGGVLLGLASLLQGTELGAEPPEVPRLSASTLTPALGERVRLELAGAADLLKPRWRGAEQGEDALLAWVEVPTDHPLDQPLQVEVELADGSARSLRLRPQAARNEGPLPAPPLALRSLPWVSGTCYDARAARLAGVWAVGCGAGVVDRAEQLQDGRKLKLESGHPMPAVAPGLLWAMGRRYGAWRLPATQPAREGPLIEEALISPPGSDGQTVALLTEDAVTVGALSGNSRQRTEARPAPWYPPAISGPWVAWVHAGDRDETGEDIYLLEPGSRAPVALTARPGHQRHVSASGRWLGWIEDEAVVVQDLEQPARRRYPADAHTARGLSTWGPVACWEQWTGEDVDIACSDGLLVQRPGHQRAPSRYGPWLLFREDAQVLLVTAEWILLDDDDPRASLNGPRIADPRALRGARVEGGVRYDLELPPGSWVVERMGPEGWETGETLEGGAARIEAPWGDAARLRAAAP